MRLTRITFAVLALMSVFTACTKEEMPTPQAEVAGAKMLGKNLSAEFPISSETKTDAQGNWVVGDKLGLAWVEASSNVLKANHMFVKETNDSPFTSYGNIYEGTHFAYYPYVYMAAQVRKQVTINPAQTETADKDIFKTRLHLSTKEVLTADHNLDGDKLVNTNLIVRRAVKALNVTLNVDENIKESTTLQGLKIKKVELSSDQDIFFGGTVELNTDAIVSPVFVDEDGIVINSTACDDEDHSHSVIVPVYPAGATFSEEETVEAFYASLIGGANKVFGNPTFTETLTTVVNNDNIDLSDDQVIRFYTLPKSGVYSDDLYKGLSLKVYVQNGLFEIKFRSGTTSNPLSAAEKANIVALKALAELYKVTGSGSDTEYGYLAAFTSDDNNIIGHASGLEFILDESMFQQSFENIASEDDWNAAIALLDALNVEENVTFTISNAERVKWTFTDKDNDGQLVNLPKTAKCKITVQGDGMYLDKAEATAPNTSAKFVVNTNVVVKSNLNVAGMFEAAKITNNAVINATASAVIKNLDNNNRVVVEYGAKVANHSEGSKGVVAYVVNGIEEEDYAKVSTLITQSAVQVNTLVIDGQAFNIHARCVSKGSYDNNHTYLSEANISSINFELINGGSIEAVRETGYTSGQSKVKKVSSISGNTAITGITLTDSLLVKGGVMTATNAEYTNIKVAENATLNINSTRANAVVKANELFVDGIVNSNVYGAVFNNLIVNPEGTLNTGYNYVVWNDLSDLRGNTSGVIAQGAKDITTLGALITLAKSGDVIYITGNIDYTSVGQLELSKKLSFNLNNNTFKGGIKTSADFNIYGGTVDSPASGYSGIEVTGTAKLNITNVNVSSGKHAVRVKSTGEVVIYGGTYKVVDGGHMTQHAINIGDVDGGTITSTKVTIKAGTFVGPESCSSVTNGAAVCVQGGSKVTIEGGDFKGAKGLDLLYAPTDDDTIVCIGGNYLGFNPENLVARGYESKLNTTTGMTYSGWYQVSAK